MNISFAGIFLEGLLSFLSPCVLPLLPLFMAYLSGEGKKDDEGNIIYDQRKTFLSTIFFVLGISFVFVLLGLSVGFISDFLKDYQDIVALIGGVLFGADGGAACSRAGGHAREEERGGGGDGCEDGEGAEAGAAACCLLRAELCAHVEAWARLCGKLVVAVDGGGGVLALEAGDEGAEGGALGRGAGVLGGASVGGEPADVADADGAVVVALAVRACLVEWAAFLHGAVEADHVVVAHVRPALGLVPGADVADAEVEAFGGGGAVEDDFGDFSHFGGRFRSFSVVFGRYSRWAVVIRGG